MGKRTIRLDLPTGWQEVPGQPQRTYRRTVPNSGTLRLSLLAPRPVDERTGESAVALLTQMLSDQAAELGEQVLASHSQCRLGSVAASIWKSPKTGIAQFWLIPAEVTILASYTMGDLAHARQEIAEANHAILGMSIEAVSD